MFFFWNEFRSIFIDASIIPCFFIILGFLIKLGAFPFSLWTPDVYEGSPPFLVFYFIITLKSSFILVFSRILFFVFIDFYEYWSLILIISAIGSFLIGSFGAFGQKNLKRFFAYTSLNQLGFILMGLSTYATESGLAAVLFFLFIYVINNILFFSIFLSFLNSNFYTPMQNLSDFKGFSFFHPWAALGLSISLFSFIGLPPLAGFFSKLFILLTAAKSNFFFAIILALFSNGISAFYYVRLLKMIWFEKISSLNSKSFFFLKILWAIQFFFTYH